MQSDAHLEDRVTLSDVSAAVENTISATARGPRVFAGSDAPPASVGAPSPDDGRLRRHAACEELGGLGRALAGGGLNEKEFADAVTRLVELTQWVDDPLVRRMGEKLLVNCGVLDYYPEDSHWPDLVAEWCGKRGDVLGPTACLRVFARNAFVSNDLTPTRSYRESDTLERFADYRINLENPQIGAYNKSKIPELIAALERATQGQAVDEAVLKAVCRLAEAFEQRSVAKLPPEIRLNETPEQDRAWAKAAADAVSRWWRSGQIEVHQDDRPVDYGRLDISSIARQGRLAVRGSCVRLATAMPPVSEETRRFLDSMDPGVNGDAGAVTAPLEELAASDPARAAEMTAALVRCAVDATSCHGVVDIWRLNILLREAATKPALKRLLATHVALMATLVSSAASRDEYYSENSGPFSSFIYNRCGCTWGDYAFDLAKVFPESVDGRTLREEIAPLFNSDRSGIADRACDRAQELLTVRPDLVAPTMDILLSTALSGDAFNIPSMHAWNLLEYAIDKGGWMPDKRQVAILAAHLYVPAPPPGWFNASGQTFFYSDTVHRDFQPAFDILEKLSERDPHLLEGLELPDTQGHMRPLRKALLDRLFNDPSFDMARRLGTNVCPEMYILTASGWDNIKRIYAFALHDPEDPELANDLLKRVESAAARTNTVNDFTPDEKFSLIMLGSLVPDGFSPQVLDDVSEKRIETVLRRLETVDQGSYDLAIVDRVRQADMAAVLQHLRTEPLTRASRLDAVESTSSFAFRPCYGEFHTSAMTVVQDGLKARSDLPGLAHLAGRLNPEDLWTVYGALAPHGAGDDAIDRAAPGFEEILDYVGGEAKLAQALEGWRYVEDMTARGSTREEALISMMSGLVLGRQHPPRVTTGTVEVGNHQVRIDGIAIPVRSASRDV